MQNKTMGNVLKAFLLVGVIMSGILLVTTFFYAFLYEVYEKVVLLDQALSILTMFTWILSIVFYLIWIYQVHADFRRLTPYYPIKPGGALLRILIPFYNLYGLWNVYSTMGDYFKGYSALRQLGKKIIQLTPVYYFLFLATDILDRWIWRSLINNGTANDMVILIYQILDFILMISLFLITKTVLNAFKVIEGDRETYQHGFLTQSNTVNE